MKFKLVFVILGLMLLTTSIFAGTIGINGGLEIFQDLTVDGIASYSGYHIFNNPYQLVDKNYVDSLVFGDVNLDGYVPYQGATKDLNFGLHNIFIDGNVGIKTTTPKVSLDVNGYMNYYNYVSKFHRIDSQTATSTNTWTDIIWQEKTIDESVGDWFILADSNQSIVINGFDGILRVQGCLHPYNNNSSGITDILRVRVLVNGVEQRCLQASRNKEFKANGMDILLFAGTINIKDGDVIKVQWETSDTSILLQGDTGFDRPISASVNFNYISRSDD